MKLKNLPVRTGFVAVLGLFGTLVLVMALLGIVSLNENNALSAKIATLNAQVIDLKDVYINNLKARSALSRAFIAISSNSSAKDGALADARRYLDLAKAADAAFEKIPKDDDDLRGAAGTVVDAFRAHSGAIDGLFAAISSGDLKAYAEANEGSMTQTSMVFGKSSEAFFTVAASQTKALQEQNANARTLLIGVAIGLLALSCVLIVLVYVGLERAIVKPLKEAVVVVEHVARGDLTVAIAPGRESSNEIGQLFVAMKEMKGSLSGIVRAVQGGSDVIVTAVQEMASGNTDLSQRTEQQAAALQQTASSMEQLTSTVRHNADNAKQATQLVNGTAALTEQGSQASKEMVATMRGLSELSGKISDITNVIESIAFQTNILSLNAAVEAARAGEEGRGFAVVASEVRSLAQRSANAAREIKERITDSLARVDAGARQVEQASSVMGEILVSVNKVNDLMGEIAAASVEQSTGIEQVNRAVAQMDQVTQQNAALVEEASAAALSLEDQTRVLKDAVAVFRTDTGGMRFA
ncbi:methyl-accepting chemotaxis protein [Burkholderia plantarii]|uniref:Methyl-accepting chemotaxis sensory transducer n=1 Tax=Burkholderia plantarii TaxID=41899 RepID=A0A0B6SD63_BURPL|nr:methyl-accepting chemotaxis protein [Burkholderia plantarii]AJK50186.1 methyl-accepting chemotaxis sensory transducer [Burkholderia plantarii]ALK34345.1 methyl-accepting chemotaxis protein [Burkholderia plantarii]WLE63390.1 Tar ligand binding domain-containing protein [Burkholderia plantarii]GLZ22132.1 methyl-accepting chemotaxis protein [Burkholderia plantarii]